MLSRFTRIIARSRIGPGGSRAATRSFMSASEYSKQVPEHLKTAYEGAMKDAKKLDKAVVQRVRTGECHLVARTVGDLVQARLATAGKSESSTRKKVSSQWTQANEEPLSQGMTAVVRGHGAETEHSEWQQDEFSTGHAVAVLGPNTGGTGFIVHDPDTTHDPARDASSPGANLRVMTSQELQAVQPTTDIFGESALPVVDQHAPSFTSRVKKWWSGS